MTGTTGEPLADVAVGFEAIEGGGSAESATAATDGDGIASPGAWTLGDPGPQRLRAAVAGLEPVVFRAFARGIPAEIAVVAGAGQEAAVGTEVAVNPEVLVTDSAGTPLPEIPVSFATERDAAVTGAEATTDTLGRAAVGSWTLGTTAGEYWIEASVEGDRIENNPARVVANALPGPAAEIVIAEGDDQRSETKLPVPVNPRVQVRDSYGNGVPGATVSFEAGGGSVVTPRARDTDSGGFAAVDWWELGPTVDATYRLAAAAREEDDAVGPVAFTATATPAVYDIEIVHADSSALSDGQLAAFERAETFWEDAISGNLQWHSIRKASLERCLSLADIELDVPGDRIVDDLLIYADAREIDGPGGIFAGAGPCQVRVGTFLPIVGVMFFDIEDLDEMEDAQDGEHLDGTILHEIAHVMGFGTVWESLGLLVDPVDPDDPTGDEDTHFVGEEALAAFDSVGGDDYEDGEPVPVQNLEGRGVVNGHWRESVFDTELMTPYLDGGVANPLSIVTLASFQDVGYEGVDLDLADDYELPESSPNSAPQASRPVRRGDDILRIPLAVVDREGRVVRYVLPGGLRGPRLRSNPPDVMDSDSDATQLVRHDSHRGLSAHLRQPDVGGQSYMADKNALGIEYVPDSILFGGANRGRFGVVGAQEPSATFIRNHQSVPGSACFRYRHIGQVILINLQQGFRKPALSHILHEHGRGEVTGLSERSVHFNLALEPSRAVHKIRRLPGGVGYIDSVVPEPKK